MGLAAAKRSYVHTGRRAPRHLPERRFLVAPRRRAPPRRRARPRPRGLRHQARIASASSSSAGKRAGGGGGGGGSAAAQLDAVRREWRAVQAAVEAGGWAAFLERAGCSEGMRREILGDVDRWVAACAAKAMTRGPKYGGGEGGRGGGGRGGGGGGYGRGGGGGGGRGGYGGGRGGGGGGGYGGGGRGGYGGGGGYGGRGGWRG